MVALSPRYEGPVIASIDGDPAGQLGPMVRQRRRFEAVLAGLDEQQWRHPTRCDDWSVRDIVAHLATVNPFWEMSVRAGLAGEPTRFLEQFDPAATPGALVTSLADVPAADLLGRFRDSGESLFALLGELSTEEWTMLAETPAGHVPIRLLAQHGLWDAWIHERDVLIPLGIEPSVEDDEATSVLQFAALLVAALAVQIEAAAPGSGGPLPPVVAVEATDPDVSFVIEIGESVSLVTASAPDGDTSASPDNVPCLRGDAVALTEALSIRAPMPEEAPPEWRALVGNLSTLFRA